MDDKVTVQCPSCQRTLRAPSSMLGKNVKCPGCQVIFQIAPPDPVEAHVQPSQPDQTMLDENASRSNTAQCKHNVRCPKCQTSFQFTAPKPAIQSTFTPTASTNSSAQTTVNVPMQPAEETEQDLSNQEPFQEDLEETLVAPRQSPSTKFPERRSKFQSGSKPAGFQKKGSTTSARRFGKTPTRGARMSEEGEEEEYVAPRKKKGSMLWLWVVLGILLIGGSLVLIISQANKTPATQSFKEDEDKIRKFLEDKFVQSKKIEDIIALSDSQESIKTALETDLKDITITSAKIDKDGVKVSSKDLAIAKIKLEVSVNQPQGDPKTEKRTMELKFTRKDKGWVLNNARVLGSTSSD